MLGAAALASQTATALQASFHEFRVLADQVHADFDLSPVDPPLLSEINKGGLLRITLAAQLWRDRVVFDSPIGSLIESTFVVSRGAPGRLLVRTAAGLDATVGDGDALRLGLDLAPLDEIVGDHQYYVRAVISTGVLAARDIERLGDAVFGSAKEGNGLADVAKLVFRKALEISEYFKSSRIEVESPRVAGDRIRRQRP